MIKLLLTVSSLLFYQQNKNKSQIYKYCFNIYRTYKLIIELKDTENYFETSLKSKERNICILPCYIVQFSYFIFHINWYNSLYEKPMHKLVWPISERGVLTLCKILTLDHCRLSQRRVSENESFWNIQITFLWNEINWILMVQAVINAA